jgi:FG-GAP repeat
MAQRLPRRWTLELALAALALVLAVAFVRTFVTGAGSPGLGSPPAVAAPVKADPLSGLRSTLPLSAQGVISSALGRDNPAFAFRHGSVDAGGMTVRVAGGAVTLRVAAGRLVLNAGLGQSTVRTRANRATASGRDLSVWFEAGPLGLEQGFTVKRGGAITLGLGGTVTAAQHGRTVTFSADGHQVFRYGGVSATDARGRALRSWMTLGPGRRLVLHMADRGAAFPVRVDPFVQAKELTEPTPEVKDGFGDSVAVSGSTIVVGSPETAVGAYTGQGAVYVFTPTTASGWSGALSSTPLTETSQTTDNDHLGISVAVSGDTVVGGANSANGGKGATWVWTAPSGGWGTGSVGAPAELTASDGASGDGFGFAVATDGSTVAVGAAADPSGVLQPVVYVFSKGAGWTTTAGDTELTIKDAVAGLDGRSIAISGSTVVAGVSDANGNQGEALVFQMPPGGWTSNTQTATLTPPSTPEADLFGWAVATSGTEVVVGEPEDAAAAPGAVFVYTEPTTSNGWAGTIGTPATLTPTNGAADDELGDSVGIETSTSPQTVVASAPYAKVGSNAGQGVVDVFTEPAAGWTGQSVHPLAQLTAGDGSSGDELGATVQPSGDVVGAAAVAIDGSTIVAGSALHASKAGAAYVFTSSTTTTTSTTSSVAPPPAGKVSAKLSKIKATPRGASDRTACTGPSGQSCSVTEELTITEKLNKHGKVTGVTASAQGKPKKKKPRSKVVVLAKKSITVGTGKSKNVTLTLNKSGKKLLAHYKKLKVILLATLKSGRKQVKFASHKLTIKPAKKHKRKHH